MLQLTFWEDPKYGRNTEDDFDGIVTLYPKSVKLIPALIAGKPKNCTMISLERSSPVLKRDGSGPTNPLNPRHFKELWRKGQPLPQVKTERCPLCGHKKEGA